MRTLFSDWINYFNCVSIKKTDDKYWTVLLIIIILYLIPLTCQLAVFALSSILFSLLKKFDVRWILNKIEIDRGGLLCNDWGLPTLVWGFEMRLQHNLKSMEGFFLDWVFLNWLVILLVSCGFCIVGLEMCCELMNVSIYCLFNQNLYKAMMIHFCA